MTKKTGRILAIDYGYARIGVALSDPSKLLASPLENLQGSKNSEKAAQYVMQFLEELAKKGHVIEEIVIGLPLKLNGTDSERTEAARAFAKALQSQVTMPVTLFDERLTSVQAERVLSISFSRKKRKHLVDRVAAVILLQTFLDQRTGQYNA